jgi:predicted flap endonuclease-1-like 5' DNA nuclease
MRSDYALYMVAIIFFVITGISAIVLSEVEQSLWVVTTAVLGLLFAGLGYSQRPRPRGRIVVETPPSTSTPIQAPSATAPMATAPMATAPTPIEPKEPVVTEVKEERIEVTTEPTPAPTVSGLIEVKGIGEKRKQQLNTLGITSINDLAMTSADELAQKLKISPKITGKWIENAKKLLEKS